MLMIQAKRSSTAAATHRGRPAGTFGHHGGEDAPQGIGGSLRLGPPLPPAVLELVQRLPHLRRRTAPRQWSNRASPLAAGRRLQVAFTPPRDCLSSGSTEQMLQDQGK